METIRIACKLDIPDLISACEQYFLEELSVNNSCEFFMDSLSMCSTGEFRSGAGNQNLVDKCCTFIEENASDVVKTEGFLNLSKEALIQLVSSDKVL